ncbi:MAG: TPM domain-containing protein [Clostridiales bacterium]|nr:TPM domain-containing protein [Clostridiales bacterium]
MKNTLNRLMALAAALLLFAAPVAAQASSIWADFLSENAAQPSTSLIDTSDDEEDYEEVAPVVTAAPAAAPVTPVTLPDASADTSRIRDDANLFTSEQEIKIAERIAQFQKNTGMDFVVMTSKKSHEGLSAMQLADDFYDYGGYGLDEENSGVAYYIDMYERYHYISTTGQMIDYMTDERIDSAINNNTRYLSGGQYAQAAMNMIDMVEDCYRRGIPEGQYQYDILTGQVLTARHKALTSGELTFSGVIAAIIGFIFNRSVNSSYKLKGNTYKYNVNENSSLRMTDTEDTYLHTTTTRVRKPEPPRSSGGGFSGGGGSGVHIGSSGSSHGGGGGHF